MSKDKKKITATKDKPLTQQIEEQFAEEQKARILGNIQEREFRNQIEGMSGGLYLHTPNGPVPLGESYLDHKDAALESVVETASKKEFDEGQPEDASKGSDLHVRLMMSFDYEEGFNTAMASIIEFSELLANGPETKEEIQEMFVEHFEVMHTYLRDCVRLEFY